MLLSAVLLAFVGLVQTYPLSNLNLKVLAEHFSQQEYPIPNFSYENVFNSTLNVILVRAIRRSVTIMPD